MSDTDEVKLIIATDGHLNVEATTTLVLRLVEPNDTVIVLTVIDHPGQLLRSFAESGAVKDLDQILGDTSPSAIGFGSGSASSERLKQLSHSQKGVAQPLDKYFADTAERYQRELVDSLSENGIMPVAMWSPTERKTARTILDVVKREEADILVIGSHGDGRFEGLLGSTVTKLVRLSQTPVLLVR